MALIQCPDCGSEVSDVAPACPKCGRPIAPPQPTAVGVQQKAVKKRNGCGTVIVLTIMVVTIILFGFGLFGGDNKSKREDAPVAESAPPAPEPTFSTTARQLAEAYEQNEVAADDAMRGKLVHVTGTIQAIDKDFTDSVVLSLATSNEFMPASMRLKDSEKPVAAGLRKGLEVTVICDQMSRVVGSPSGRDCVIAQ